MVKSIPEETLNGVKESVYNSLSNSLSNYTGIHTEDMDSADSVYNSVTNKLSNFTGIDVDSFNNLANRFYADNDTAQIIKENILSGVSSISSIAQNGSSAAFQEIKKSITKIPTKTIWNGLKQGALNLSVDAIKEGATNLVHHVPQVLATGASSLGSLGRLGSLVKQARKNIPKQVYEVLVENIPASVVKQITDNLPAADQLKSMGKNISIPKKTVSQVANIFKQNYIDRMDIIEAQHDNADGIFEKIQDTIENMKDFFEKLAFRFISKYIWFAVQENWQGFISNQQK